MTYSSLGTEIDLPGSPAYKKYWGARAKQCQMFADEGSCLARVARHVPVSIEMGGLGFTNTVPALETNLLKQQMLAWGAWPDTNADANPLYLFAFHNGPMPTISTSRALTLLKYDVVAAGAVGLLVGWAISAARKRSVAANRRRRRR